MTIANSRFVRSEKIVSSTIDDELLMLDPDQGKYFGTGAVGKRTWEILQVPVTISEIVGQLMEEFEVTEDVCRADVVKFLEALRELKLIDPAQ